MTPAEQQRLLDAWALPSVADEVRPTTRFYCLPAHMQRPCIGGGPTGHAVGCTEPGAWDVCAVAEDDGHRWPVHYPELHFGERL